MTTTDLNYICARWRDAVTDPPMVGWVGLCKKPDGYFYVGSAANFYADDQWLDVSDIPAVPRAAVQAAMDEMGEGTAPLMDGTLTDSGQIFELCADIVERYTGVAPSEVTP